MPRSAGRANIGAGTITCNYDDGFLKYRTVIGEGGVRRIEQRARRAGDDRGGRDRRCGIGRDAGRRRRRAGASPAGGRKRKPGWAARFRALMAARKKSDIEDRKSMCGIIGIVGKEEVCSRLLAGLRRLEYRGYDSAGIATDHDGRDRPPSCTRQARQSGARAGQQDPLPGHTGIAHTRWATHGAPTEDNAHPHATAEVAVVHNGIIENFKALREELQARGRVFTSQTDTEVVAHLVSEQVERGAEPQAAVAAVLKRLKGAFALAILFRSPSGPADRRAARLAAGGGLWRGRNLSRLRRAGACAADPADHLSRRGRLGGGRLATARRSTTATTGRSSARSRSRA